MERIIRNAAGERLDYSFASGRGDPRYPDWLVVLGHGVTGNKDRPVIADTAQALNAAGFDTLRFSFAGNGDSEGDFRHATISKEVDDLDAVLEAVTPLYTRVCYIGHSMGGAVGVLKAATDPRINALVSLAGMIETKAFAKAEFGQETPDSGCMWDEPSCPLSAVFMEDLCEHVGTVAPQIADVRVRWLLLHGTTDDVVLPQDSKQVQASKGGGVTVRFIEGADHSFNEPSHKAEMTEAVCRWLSEICQ